jgi:hypothetical protein
MASSCCVNRPQLWRVGVEELVVKLKRESANRNPTNSFSKATVQRAKVFLRNVRGVAFYAVPHAGSSNIANYVNKLLRCNNKHHPGIMENVQPWQRDMEELSEDFDDIVNGNNINIYAFCEGMPMKQVVRMYWMKWIFCNQIPVLLSCCFVQACVIWVL